MCLLLASAIDLNLCHNVTQQQYTHTHIICLLGYGQRLVASYIQGMQHLFFPLDFNLLMVQHSSTTTITVDTSPSFFSKSFFIEFKIVLFLIALPLFLALDKIYINAIFNRAHVCV